MLSALDICNQALALLGEGPVEDLSAGTYVASVCSAAYGPAMDEVLSGYVWNCCITRRQLAAEAGDSFSPFAYRYRLPVDPYCLRVVNLLDPESYVDLPYERFQVEGRTILADISPCYLKYAARVSEENLDPWVAQCLVYALAAQVAMRLTADQNRIAMASQAYTMKRIEAMQIDGMNRMQQTRAETNWSDIG